MNPAELKGQFEAVLKEIEAEFSDLPPRTQDRLWQIIADHGVPPEADLPYRCDLLTRRSSVMQEKRGDGRIYWRLYSESGSRHSGNLKRKRIYVGKEGGLQLRKAIAMLRKVYFTWLGESWGLGPCKDQAEFLRKVFAALDAGQGHYDDDEAEGPMTMEKIRTWEDLVKAWNKGPAKRR